MPLEKTPVGVLQSVVSLTGQRDRELLERTLVRTLVELMPDACVRLYLLAPAEQGEELVLTAMAPPEDDTLNRPVLALAAHADFQQVRQSGEALSMQQAGARPFRAVHPILSQQNVVGLLEIETAEAHEADQRLVFAFLKIYSNYLSLLDESETDTLTGLLNRRTFDNNLEKIIADHAAPDSAERMPEAPHPLRRAANANLPHWLAIIDIDHFKRINDEFGHLYGDEVLILLARIMQRVFRQRDKLFRFGGEEFIVVLDRTSNENAWQVLERFRKVVEQYEFPQIKKVTISIGFVRLEKAEVPSAIIGRADQALYYAKHHGRNQVCQYEDLLHQGKLHSEHYSDDLQLF